MKFFANKKNIQKIVIAILIILSFNFVVPKKVQALDAVGSVLGGIGGFIMDPFLALLTTIVDAAFNGIQDFMLGSDDHAFFMIDRDNESEYYGPTGDGPKVKLKDEDYSGAIWGLGDYKIPMIKYSPEAIFANKVPVLDANFLKSNMRELPTDQGENTMQSLRNVVASWYVAIRMMAIVGLLSVLVYLAIRMMISGIAADKAKYKKMFMDWLVAMCLLFFLHYIMSFAQTISETLVGMISSAGETAIDVSVGDMTQFSTNLIGVVRFQMQHVDTIQQVTYFVIYIMMVFYTIKFTWIYLKRMLTMAFLTLIAPMVALTYPIDKVGDGKAQAFDMWVKEYVYNTLIQPLHCLIYTIFSAATVAVAAKNPLLAVVIFPCLTYAEKFLKQMLGFNKASGGSVPGLATSVGAHALGTMVGNLGKAGKGGGKPQQGKVRTADSGGKRMPNKDATKNLEGFEKSAGGALDFGRNEEFGEGEDEQENKKALPEGQDSGTQQSPQQPGEHKNPELEEQQKDWQRNNIEMDPNDIEMMNQMQDILDDPDASEEEKEMARDQLAYYNDAYGMNDQSANRPQDILDNPNASEEEKKVARNQLRFHDDTATRRIPNPEDLEAMPVATTPKPGYDAPKEKEKKPRKALKDRPYLGMGSRVIGGLANDAKENLSEAWANKGAIARGAAAATGKLAYSGAKGATKAFIKSMPAAAVGAATFAAGSVLTGDISKGAGLAAAAAAGTYGLAGKGGEAAFGKLGGRVEDLMGVSGGVRETYDRRRYGSEIAGRQARADKAFANSKEFNEYLKYYYKDSDERAAAKKEFMEYRKAGVTDLDDIRKAYKAQQQINKDVSKVGGRAISTDEMINTVKLDKKISTRAFTDTKVYNAEKDRIANQLFSGSVKNKDKEARRVMETLKALRNV